jgi:hypothetical protein
MNILIPCARNPPKVRQTPKPAQKNKNVKRAAPVEILKPHPRAPLTSEVDDQQA